VLRAEDPQPRLERRHLMLDAPGAPSRACERGGRVFASVGTPDGPGRPGSGEVVTASRSRSARSASPAWQATCTAVGTRAVGLPTDRPGRKIHSCAWDVLAELPKDLKRVWMEAADERRVREGHGMS
jgi:hypothetical protein